MDIVALNNVLDRIEKLAFDIPPPNSYTPRIVLECQLMRRLLNDEGARPGKPQLVITG